MSVIVDTGILLAAADAGDADHQRCAELLRDNRGKLLVPAPVVPECSWQIVQYLGAHAEASFLRLITGSELKVIDLTVADYGRCAELIETYAGLGLGLVDASVVTVAENLRIETVATLNRRDFTVVRPRHVTALNLIP